MMRTLLVSVATAAIMRRAFQPSSASQWLALGLGSIAAGMGSRRGPVAAWAATLAAVAGYQLATWLEIRRVASSLDEMMERVEQEWAAKHGKLPFNPGR